MMIDRARMHKALDSVIDSCGGRARDVDVKADADYQKAWASFQKAEADYDRANAAWSEAASKVRATGGGAKAVADYDRAKAIWLEAAFKVRTTQAAYIEERKRKRDRDAQ